MPRHSKSRTHDKDERSSSYSSSYKSGRKKSKHKQVSDSHYRRSPSSSSRSSRRDRDRDRERNRERRRRSTSRSSNSSARSVSSSSTSHSRSSVEYKRSTELNAGKSSTTSTIMENVVKPSEFVLQSDNFDIEGDSFIPRQFYSSKKEKEKTSKKMIIDLNDDNPAIVTPHPSEPVVLNAEQIYHEKFLGSETKKMEKWVKKFYAFRQKYKEDN